MILYAEEGLLFVFYTGNRLIIQIEVGNFSELIINAFRINTESVVVRSDLYFLRAQILNRLVATAMPKFKLKALGTQGQAEHLVAKADAKQRFFGSD